MQQHGDTVAGKKIEIIRKDIGGVAPDVAKRLAQELVVRDKVDILAGFVLTPNALAAADVSAAGEEIDGDHECRDLDHHDQVALFGAHLDDAAAGRRHRSAMWAAKNGIKKAYTMVSDYGPGHDAEAAFTARFKEAGGEIVGSVRLPVANPDFSAFVQRAKDLNPESIFIFVPGGAQPAAFGKAFAERGVDPTRSRYWARARVTAEQALKSMGDAALGIITAWHYDYKHDADEQVAFVEAYNEMHKAAIRTSSRSAAMTACT